jgi:hypothetical protein
MPYAAEIFDVRRYMHEGRMNRWRNARVVLGVALVLSLPCALRGGAIYLQDDFFNGSRTVQNLPNSAAWYAADGSAGLTVVADQLQLNTASGDDGTLAYFDPTTVTLGIGQSLEVSFDFTLSGALAPQDRAFGVFLYNSGGNRLTADDTTGFDSALFNAYTGYGITYDPDSDNPARYRTVERNVTAHSLFTSTANVGIGSPAASSVLTPGQTYLGSLTLIRTSSSIIVEGDINGSLISNVDPSSSYTQFDTVAFLAVSSDIPELTLNNIEVMETSTVPEPSTLVLLGCGLLFLLVQGTRKGGRRVFKSPRVGKGAGPGPTLLGGER